MISFSIKTNLFRQLVSYLSVPQQKRLLVRSTQISTDFLNCSNKIINVTRYHGGYSFQFPKRKIQIFYKCQLLFFHTFLVEFHQDLQPIELTCEDGYYSIIATLFARISLPAANVIIHVDIFHTFNTNIIKRQK